MLNILILGCKTPVLPLQRHGLLDKSLLTVLLCNAATEELRWTLDDGPHLRKLGWLGLAIFLLVMPLGVQHGTHPKELEISPEFRSQLRLGQIEPTVSGCRFVLVKQWLSAGDQRYFTTQTNGRKQGLNAQSNYEMIKLSLVQHSPRRTGYAASSAIAWE